MVETPPGPITTGTSIIPDMLYILCVYFRGAGA